VSFTPLIRLMVLNCWRHFWAYYVIFFAERICQFPGICAQWPFSACGHWPGTSVFLSGTFVLGSYHFLKWILALPRRQILGAYVTLQTFFIFKCICSGINLNLKGVANSSLRCDRNLEWADGVGIQREEMELLCILLSCHNFSNSTCGICRHQM